MAVNHVHVLICYGLYLLLDLAENAMGQLISIYPFSFQEHIYLIFFPIISFNIQKFIHDLK